MLNQGRQLANNNIGHSILLYFPQLASDKVRLLLLHTFACLENLTFSSFLIYEARLSSLNRLCRKLFQWELNVKKFKLNKTQHLNHHNKRELQNLIFF